MKEFKFTINGKAYEAAVEELENNMASVTINGKAYQVELEEEQAAPVVARPAAVAAAPAAAKSAGAVSTVKSPLPGSIVKVLVKDGQDVKKGDILLTMESMKMENQVAAEYDGKVVSVMVQAGQNVMQDDALLQIQAAGQAAAPAAAPVAAPAPKAAPAAPKAAAAPAAKPAAGAKVVKSPLPGSIIKVKVAEGAAVKKGDTLLTMESMKMENEIKAESDGTVGTIFVKEGQNVMQDDNLLEIK